MAFKLVLPRFGMAMQKAKVIEWKKEIGDFVKKEEAVLVVENEKLTNEIISMEAGVLLKKIAEVGEDYFVGDTLAWLGAEGETIGDNVRGGDTGREYAVGGSVVGGSAAGGSRIAISPLAKKLAAELGIDYTKIPGADTGGRIGKEDVLKYAESLKQQAASGGESTPEASASAEGPDTTAHGFVAPVSAAPERCTVTPYTGMRKAVGDKMQNAWAAIPMVTHHVKADAGALLELRRQLNDGVEEKGSRYTINELLLKLTAVALQKIPALNATFENDGIHIHRNVNLGIATALENGLIVPVIHKAEEKSLKEISIEAKELIAAARDGRLSSGNISGGTFTVSNLGGYGSVDFFTPIIDPPQVAILGIGRTEDAAAPVGGVISIRPMIGLSLTYDHRAIDGAKAAEFMKEFITMLGTPLRALMGL